MAKIVIKNARASYVNVFKARAIEEGATPKYDMQVIVPKDHPQIEALRKAIADTAREKFPKKVNGDKLVGLKSPLRDGDDERIEAEYQGMYFFNCSSTRRPTVLDRDKSQLAEEDGVIYSGCYVNVSVNFFAYDKAGNRGVGAGLNGLQFHRDGDRLDGGSDAFGDFDDESGEGMDDDLI